MPGLVPGTHVFRTTKQGVGGRDIRAFTPVFDGLCPAMTCWVIQCKRNMLYAAGAEIQRARFHASRMKTPNGWFRSYSSSSAVSDLMRPVSFRPAGPAGKSARSSMSLA